MSLLSVLELFGAEAAETVSSRYHRESLEYTHPTVTFDLRNSPGQGQRTIGEAASRPTDASATAIVNLKRARNPR